MKRGNARSTVVVLRALRGLGDILVAVPALRHLRRSLPHADIRFIGLDETASLVGRFSSYVDSFVAFPGWPGIPEHSLEFDPDWRRNVAGADMVVQMHGDGSVSNGFCASLHPRMLSTFGAAVVSHGTRVLTRPARSATNEVDRCLDVAQAAAHALGGDRAPLDRELEFPLHGDDRWEAKAVSDAVGIRGPYACLHAGSHLPDRRWPAERFATVGRALARRSITPVITGGPAERALCAWVARRIGPSAIDASGLFTIGGMAAFLSHARGIVTNDTGISHLAVAVKTPSVVVFMASDPRRWAPVDATLHKAVVPSPHASPLPPVDIAPSVSQTLDAVQALGIAD